MLNKIKRTAKEGTSKFIKAIAVVGTTLFITLNVNANPTSADVQKEIKEVFKKNPDKEIVVKVENNKSTEKTAKFEAVQDSIDALDFAVQNIDKYYPDMKEHLTTMINSFRDQEHRDSTVALLNKMVENISDPIQKTGAVIYALEGVFRGDQPFSLKYDSKITDETFAHIEQFDNDYKARFNRYYERLVTKSEELKKALSENQQKLETSKKEFEETMKKFSPEDIKVISGMKERILEIQKMYLDNDLQIPEHMQLLFDAAK